MHLWPSDFLPIAPNEPQFVVSKREQLWVTALVAFFHLCGKLRPNGPLPSSRHVPAFHFPQKDALSRSGESCAAPIPLPGGSLQMRPAWVTTDVGLEQRIHGDPPPPR